MLIKNTHLQTLILIKCPKIINYSTISNCKLLKEIEIRKSQQIQDEDLEKIAKNGKLIRVRFEECVQITNKAVHNLLINCSLKEVNIIDIRYIKYQESKK